MTKLMSRVLDLTAALAVLPAMAGEQIVVVERPVGETTVDLGERRLHRRPAGLREQGV